MNKANNPPQRVFTREEKVMLITALKRGYFEDVEIQQLKDIVCPDANSPIEYDLSIFTEEEKELLLKIGEKALQEINK